MMISGEMSMLRNNQILKEKYYKFIKQNFKAFKSSYQIFSLILVGILLAHFVLGGGYGGWVR